MWAQGFECIEVILKLFLSEHDMNIAMAGPTNPNHAVVNFLTIKVLLILFILMPSLWDEVVFRDIRNISLAQFTGAVFVEHSSVLSP